MIDHLITKADKNDFNCNHLFQNIELTTFIRHKDWNYNLDYQLLKQSYKNMELWTPTVHSTLPLHNAHLVLNLFRGFFLKDFWTRS